jgi:hypothetical protein
VRGITGTIALVLLVGYLAATVELPNAWSHGGPEKRVDLSDGWRRTTGGWEWREAWVRPPRTLDPPPAAWRLHPAILAAAQLLVSLLALVWTDRTWFPGAGYAQH